MRPFVRLLRDNRNYRYTWLGQIVSEIGDHFNNIAVFSLVLENTQSGLAVSGVMLARALAMVLGGPIAGVVLDRFDRKKIMIASDVARMAVALCFIFMVDAHHIPVVYLLSGLLMFASPFFTSGRASILPTITTREELHTANSLTQATQFTTLTLGTFSAGLSASQFGFKAAFAVNAASFLVSALLIARLRAPGRGFRAARKALTESEVVRPWHEYAEGLRYLRATPLLLGISLLGVGWASGGGAAQILFTLFGEVVFKKGAAGIGIIWGCAGIGLIFGAVAGHWLGERLTFVKYKRTIAWCYVVHGLAYVAFSRMEGFGAALFFMGLSRFAVAISSVMNYSMLLRHVSDEFRGRVFSTVESLVWATMMVSMTLAGFASEYYSPRLIGVWSGVLSSLTAVYWIWMNAAGRLPEPARVGVAQDEVEVHGDPRT